MKVQLTYNIILVSGVQQWFAILIDFTPYKVIIKYWLYSLFCTVKHTFSMHWETQTFVWVNLTVVVWHWMCNISSCNKYFFTTKNKKMSGENDRRTLKQNPIIHTKLLSLSRLNYILPGFFLCIYFLKVYDYIVFVIQLHIFKINKEILTHNTKLVSIWSNWGSHRLLGKIKISTILWKTVWWSLLRLNICRANNLAILLLGTYPTDPCAYDHQ